MELSSAPPAKKARLSTANQKKRPPMHSGRWTPEEEQYVEGMIAEFNAGLLPIAEGTTLRSFLAKMLNCNPKRVSKKYDGNPIYNGKAAYARAKNELPPAEACARQENLLELERKFREALSTMQRVESRLQSLTARMMQQEQSKTSANKEESSRSSSAVSSLTDCDADVTMDPDLSKTDETSTLIAQVSQTDAGSSNDSKPTAASIAGADEAAASQMLLQLNALKPSHAPTAVAPSPPKDEVPGQGELLLKSLYEAQAKKDASKKRKEPPASVAAVQTQKDSNTSNSNSIDQVNLQTMLQKLSGIRQNQPVTATSAVPNQSNLQGFLSLSATAPSSYDSPLQQPGDTRQNLQDLLQLVQQQQPPAAAATAAPSTGSGVPAVANLLQQMGACAPAQQMPQQQQSSAMSQAYLDSVLRTIPQQQQQQQQSPIPSQNIQNLILRALGGESKPSSPPPVSNNAGAALVQTLVQQMGAIGAAQPQPTAPAPAPVVQQQPLGSFLQSTVQTSQAPQVSLPQQQQQATNVTMQGVLNSMVAQQQQQPPPPPPQQPNLSDVLGSLINQVCPNNVVSQQHPSPAIAPQIPNEATLLTMLQNAAPTPQQPKSHIASSTTDAQASLQTLLAQLQQQTQQPQSSCI